MRVFPRRIPEIAVPIAAALFLVLAPLAGAAGPATVYRAPYVAHANAAQYVTIAHCAHAKIVSPATFHNSTGRGAFAIRVVAPALSCAHHAGSGQSHVARIVSSFLVQMPLKLASGARSIVVSWRLAAMGNESLTPGNCSPTPAATSWSCRQDASVNLGATMMLADLTSRTTIYASNNWSGVSNASSNVSCFTAGCSNSSTGAPGVSYGFSFVRHLAWFINLTVPASPHAYALLLEFFGSVEVSVQDTSATSVGASEAASLNVATLGNAAKLRSIVAR